jgi:hypothetical protein
MIAWEAIGGGNCMWASPLGKRKPRPRENPALSCCLILSGWSTVRRKE